MKRSKQARRPFGGSMIELPICLWLLVVMFFVPLFDLAIIGMRVITVYTAARNAASAAARSETFSDAVKIAPLVARSTFENGFGGVQFAENDLQTRIVGTSIDGRSENFTSESRLHLVNRESYVYEFETELYAAISPPITLSSALFGKVPGLTLPFTIHVASHQAAEHPRGLAT